MEARIPEMWNSPEAVDLLTGPVAEYQSLKTLCFLEAKG